jgi:DNA polymerase-3 subunit epsilon/ATP-dependent DNA helicase DinG
MLESRTDLNIMLNLYNNLEPLKSEYYVISENLNEFIFEPNKKSVYWVEKDIKSSKIELGMAPIEVAQILNDNLFTSKDSVILTSATLSTNQSFEHIKNRLGLEVDKTEIYPSPFEYKESTLMLMPESIPDPRDENYIDHVSDSIRMASLSAKGRTLALFTSHSSIRKVYEKLKPILAENKIDVLAQSISGNPQQLVNHLRKNPNTLLLGTSSMWEGIDIRGDSLQILIITRLPFGVPTDPIYQARSEKYKNPFIEFAIPTAILKFKQGFGRLIRSDTDRGIFIMLDNRVSTKRYGGVFIKSLPTMDKQKYKGEEMMTTIKTWLKQTNTR